MRDVRCFRGFCRVVIGSTSSLRMHVADQTCAFDPYPRLSHNLPVLVMTVPDIQLKACHNCRRERRKCDRNVPSCLKCIQRGRECLGYQGLFRWGQGMASRGKLRGISFDNLAKTSERSSVLSSPRHVYLGSFQTPSERSTLIHLVF